MIKNNIWNKIFLLLIITNVMSSCEKDEEKPGTLNVTTEWRNQFDGKDNAAFSSNQEVPSGSSLIFRFDLGGGDISGLKSIDIVRVNSRGSSKCLYTTQGFSGMVEPVSENTSFVFTANLENGTTSSFDTIKVRVANDNKTNTFWGNITAYSTSDQNFFSKYFSTLALKQIYTVGVFNKSDFNANMIDFCISKEGDDLFITSPSLFSSLNILSDMSAFSCSYKKVLFQTYTGAINFSNVKSAEDDIKETYSDLESAVQITNTDEKLKLVKGAHIMMQTSDGKKAIVYVKDITNKTAAELIMLYQR